MIYTSKPPAPEHLFDQHDATECSKQEDGINLSREETLVLQEEDVVAILVLGGILLEEESKSTSQHLRHTSTLSSARGKFALTGWRSSRRGQRHRQHLPKLLQPSR
jgi:hypothetical protein